MKENHYYDKGWCIVKCSGVEYNMIDILYDGIEVASIRKENFSKGEPIIEFNKSEKKHILNLNWFTKLLQDINENFVFLNEDN